MQQSNAAHVYYLHATFETTDACPMLLRGKLKQFNESQIRLTDPVYVHRDGKFSLLEGKLQKKGEGNVK